MVQCLVGSHRAGHTLAPNPDKTALAEALAFEPHLFVQDLHESFEVAPKKYVVEPSRHFSHSLAFDPFEYDPGSHGEQATDPEVAA